jgi:UDP:flavonoid glycosyltransferase YjiC (YdhE family)
MNVLLCPMSDPGYLYPVIAVGLELRRRGENVSVLGRPAAAAPVAAAGLPFVSALDYGEPHAFNVGRWFHTAAGQLRAIRRAARDARADVLLTSVLCHGALLAAEILDRPAVVLGFAVHLWPYAGGVQDEPAQPAARDWRLGVMLGQYRAARAEAGLPELGGDGAYRALTGAGLLLRGAPELEYPGAALPDGVSHAGPCWWEPSADPDELDRIDRHLRRSGKPTVYVHLGRVFGGASPWPRLNAAFTGGAMQAVVELGRSDDPQPAADADLLLVREPWLGPLVDRADLVLTSATSAPVLGALSRGRPLAVMPAGSEQPLLAEACVRAGVAVRLPEEAGPATGRLLHAAALDPDLRGRAADLAAALPSDGAARAADRVQAAAAGGRRPPRTRPTEGIDDGSEGDPDRDGAAGLGTGPAGGRERSG